MDFTTPNDRLDDPGLKDPMLGHMDPKVPCEVMPTRHCVARWDANGEGGGKEVAASTVCPTVCWRFSRKV
jgi:hypothetical protein